MRMKIGRAHRAFRLTVILLAFGALEVATASDWAQWRGPNRDGLSAESGLLKDWPEGGPPLVWKATGLGDGYSSVAVVGDRIYTAGDKEASSFVLALDVSNGKPVWSTKLGRAGAPGDPPFEGPRSMPAVSSDLLYAVSQWGELVCYETATGKERWRKDYEKDFGGKMPKWGFSESPLVDGDKLVVTPGGEKGTVVALDKNTGATIWQSKEWTDLAHYSSVIIAEIGGIRQYIQLSPDNVAGVAASDGKLLWRAPRKGRTAVIPTPIYSDNMVYVTSGYGVGCNLFKITAESGHFSAEQVYENKVMADHHGGVIKLGDFVYGHSEGKGWTCQDFKTGEAKWQEKDKLRKGSIAFADGRFYLRQEDGKGTVALIEAAPDGYKEHGRFDQPDRSSKNSWAHPVVAGGKLYLRDQDLLFCYNIASK